MIDLERVKDLLREVASLAGKDVETMTEWLDLDAHLKEDAAREREREQQERFKWEANERADRAEMDYEGENRRYRAMRAERDDLQAELAELRKKLVDVPAISPRNT